MYDVCIYSKVTHRDGWHVARYPGADSVHLPSGLRGRSRGLRSVFELFSMVFARFREVFTCFTGALRHQQGGFGPCTEG